MAKDKEPWIILAKKNHGLGTRFFFFFGKNTFLVFIFWGVFILISIKHGANVLA